MEVTQYRLEEMTLVIIHGPLDSNTDAVISEIILNIPPQETIHLWVDCSDINEIIRLNKSLSGFLNYLLERRQEGVQILLYGVNRHTAHILSLLKLNGIFRQAATLDEAYLQLGPSITA